MPTEAPSDVLPTRAVARLLGVHVDTVTRWADAGKLPCFRTPGGQRRYLRSDVERIRDEAASEPAAASA